MASLRCEFCMWSMDDRCRLRECNLNSIRESEVCLAFTKISDNYGG